MSNFDNFCKIKSFKKPLSRLYARMYFWKRLKRFNFIYLEMSVNMSEGYRSSSSRDVPAEKNNKSRIRTKSYERPRKVKILRDYFKR